MGNNFFATVSCVATSTTTAMITSHTHLGVGATSVSITQQSDQRPITHGDTQSTIERDGDETNRLLQHTESLLNDLSLNVSGTGTSTVFNGVIFEQNDNFPTMQDVKNILDTSFG